LLKLITRIIEPTSGQVTVQGRVSALLELGAGFHPELTGRDNIYLYGSVLGLKRKQMADCMQDIIRFAELERFIDVPVKFYSSGMYVRLAFAVATSVQADILLVDEVLAVGDHAFQEKCLDRISAMRQEGITILLISHDLDTIRRLCTRVIWIDKGILEADGNAESVTTEYLAHVYNYEEAKAEAIHVTQHQILAESTQDIHKDNESGASSLNQNPEAGPPRQHEAVVIGEEKSLMTRRWCTLEAEITDVLLQDKNGNNRYQLLTGEPASIIIRYTAHQRILQPVFGVSIFRSDGTHMCGSNTATSGMAIEAIEGSGEIEYHIQSLPLLAGSYTITAAIHNADESRVYDYQQCYYSFRVHLGDVKERYGQFYTPGASWSLHTYSTPPKPGQYAG